MKYSMKYTGLLGILTVGCLAGGNIEIPSEPNVSVIIEESKKDYFISFSGGVAFFNVEAYPETISFATKGALDDQGGLVELAVGYRIDKHMFMTLAVQRSGMDIADVDNIYASINYQISDKVLHPYIGVLAGYSQLKWTKAPDSVDFSKDLSSTSAIYGVQLGLEEKLNYEWFAFAKYQLIAHDHLIDIYTPGHKSIEHNYAQNVLIGISYVF